MKQLLFITLIALISACGNKSKGSSESSKSDVNIKRLEVYAFHGTRQCETCKHMKLFTKSTLEKYFKSELKSGAIVYDVVDVDDETNYDLAKKFEATGTALMINNVKAGKDNIEDWSEFAFEFANRDQAAYELELKKMIEAQLK